MTPPAKDVGSTFSKAVLAIDAPRVAGEIEEAIRAQVLGILKRRGAVVGLSGGIDSAVVGALCARALGPDRVLGLLMPERASASESLELGKVVAAAIGVEAQVEDIGPALAQLGCYRRQTDAIRTVFPDYQESWRFKIGLMPRTDGDRLNVFQLTVETDTGAQRTGRLPLPAYLQLVASTNFKQRLRKMVEYYHADRMHRAVAGTPNRLEYDQGFFVKQGDGSADFKPIAHLYKSQVYALAEYLGIPEDIRRRPPTTDTYSMPQTQEEFYFALPYHQMDLCLYGHNHHVPSREVALALGLQADQVEWVYRDIESKRRSTRYLHQSPLMVQPVAEV